MEKSLFFMSVFIQYCFSESSLNFHFFLVRNPCPVARSTYGGYISANYSFTNSNLDEDQFYCGKCDSFFSNEVDYANHLNQHSQALKRKAPTAPPGDFFVESSEHFSLIFSSN